jgi:hypothetical protein
MMPEIPVMERWLKGVGGSGSFSRLVTVDTSDKFPTLSIHEESSIHDEVFALLLNPPACPACIISQKMINFFNFC